MGFLRAIKILIYTEQSEKEMFKGGKLCSVNSYLYSDDNEMDLSIIESTEHFMYSSDSSFDHTMPRITHCHTFRYVSMINFMYFFIETSEVIVLYLPQTTGTTIISERPF